MSFLGGFGPAFVQSLTQAQDKKAGDAKRKLQVKLYEQELMQNEAAAAKTQRQTDFWNSLGNSGSPPPGGTNNILSAFPRASNTETSQAFALGEPVDKRDAHPDMMVQLGDSPDPARLQAQTRPQTQGQQQPGDGLLNLLAGVSLNEIAKVFDVDTALRVQEARQHKTMVDVNRRKRWTTGPNAGKLVFPDVEEQFVGSSPEGKAFADYKAITDEFGADSEEARWYEKELKGDTGQDWSTITPVRKEFNSRSKDNAISLRSFKQLEGFATDESSAGDTMLVFSLMKLLDPGSRVTGGEVALATDIGGAASQFLNIYNRLVKGEKLGKHARADILYQASHIARGIVADQRRIEEHYNGIADRGGVNRADIVFDFVGDAEKVILPEDAKKPIKTMEELAESVESQGFFPTVFKAVKTYFEDGTDEDEVGSPYKGWTNAQLIEELERLD